MIVQSNIPEIIVGSMHLVQLTRMESAYKRMRRRLVGFGLNGQMVYVRRSAAVELVQAEIARRKK